MRGDANLNASSWISDYDMYLLEEGTHCRAYEKMGAPAAQQRQKQDPL
jgi:hypothetical protein